MSKSFSSIEEAFAWYLEHVYKNLPPEEKKGELVSAWRSFKFKQGISQKRMIHFEAHLQEVAFKNTW
jgi:predicted ATP-binding protein involved in virulence